MNNKKKALIINVISLFFLIALLNIDSLVIKEETGLIAFRATYISIYIVLFIISIISSRNTGYIPGIFNPIIKRYNEFSRNYQIFIGVSVAIGLLIFFVLAVLVMIYIF